MTFATVVPILFTSFVFRTNAYWSVIHGIKRKPHLSVVWNWYHFVAIAILHINTWYKYAIATQWYQFHTTDAWWFSLMICAWINVWVNNLEAGDLRRNRAHDDVIVIICDDSAHARNTGSGLTQVEFRPITLYQKPRKYMACRKIFLIIQTRWSHLRLRVQATCLLFISWHRTLSSWDMANSMIGLGNSRSRIRKIKTKI